MGEGLSAENDAPTQRGHTLIVEPDTRYAERFPHADPSFVYSILCHNQALCDGWQTCGHEACRVGSPWGDENEAEPWYEEEEWEFHGILHTFRFGYDWTVPFDGCVVAEQVDAISDAAHGLPVGEYLVDDEWDDEFCTLTRITPPGASADE